MANIEKLGSHYITTGTIITDTITNQKYEVLEITSLGLKQKQVTSISEPLIVFTAYEQLETYFNQGHISISGYEPTDGKILHLLISDLIVTSKESEKQKYDSIPVTRLQLIGEESIKVKKRVKAY